MVGDALSLADLLLAAHLSMFALAPEGAAILREHENLTSCPRVQATTCDRLLERAAAA
jgi:glutathione S-transferase